MPSHFFYFLVNHTYWFFLITTFWLSLKENFLLLSIHKCACSSIVLTLNGLFQIGQYILQGLIFLLQHGFSSYSTEDSNKPCTSSTYDPIKVNWRKQSFQIHFHDWKGSVLLPAGLRKPKVMVYCCFLWRSCLCFVDVLVD